MKTVKCPRCGKENVLNVKTAGKDIKCSHCNCIMTIDKQTKKRIFIAKIAYAFIFILLVSFIYSMFSSSITDVASIAIIIVAGIASAASSDIAANWLIFKFSALTYERKQ
ncbi:hypothetical protein SDC9_129147 [bioreactor metagenome]|uniref:Uncharacterized protein n=1 Tax=bioreactor metagenome TaxID=1076179 RepID=A0A645CYU0_9ZZZZ|nr:hypothetical protein [Erysipelotrichaceae bacterium]